LVAAIAEGQEAGAVEAEFSALGAGLWRCGIPRHTVSLYETVVKSDNYLVIVHARPDEVIRAKEIFEPLQVVDVAVHQANQKPVTYHTRSVNSIRLCGYPQYYLVPIY